MPSVVRTTGRPLLFRLISSSSRPSSSSSSSPSSSFSLPTRTRTFSTSKCNLEQFHAADEATLSKVTAATRTNGRVALVDFYADWCGPCKTLSPILEKLADDTDTRTGSGLPIDLITVDTDEHSALAQRYNVRALPTVVAFRGGEVVKQFVGALPEGGVRKFLQEV